MKLKNNYPSRDEGRIHIASCMTSQAPYHESKISIMIGSKNKLIIQNRLIGKILMWLEPNLRVLGDNDINASLGYGVRQQFLASNATLTGYAYYDCNKRKAVIQGKLFSHHLTVGTAFTQPNITLNINLHARFAKSKYHGHDFIVNNLHLHEVADTINGINCKLSTKLSAHSLLEFSYYNRQVECNINRIKICRTIDDSPISSSSIEVSRSRNKTGIAVSYCYTLSPQWNVKLNYAYDSLTGSKPSMSLQWHMDSHRFLLKRSTSALWQPVDRYIGPPLSQNIGPDETYVKKKTKQLVEAFYAYNRFMPVYALSADI